MPLKKRNPRGEAVPAGAALVSGVLRLCLVLFCVAVAVFLLMKLSPIDPVDAYLGPAMARLGPEHKERIAEAWGLNRPLAEQFLLWAGHLLRGELGWSTTYNAPVGTVLADRIGASLALSGLAWLLSGILGFALGLVAAILQGGWTDRIIRIWCYLLASTPTFWLAMLMLMLFSVHLGWTPICCAGPVGVDPQDIGLGQRLHHLLLPLLALTLFGVAQIALHTRAKVIEVLGSDHVTFARAQGAGRADIALRHAARNAALPALTLLCASTGEIFGGSILAEQVFAWPGLGRASIEAARQGDVPLLLAISLLTALVVTSANILADLLSRFVDPRMRRVS
ncbi:ABC transporter permease [Pontibaca methylaminivorans]|uniref:ABC transporter permease n=1 Tax=Pontibaca methylaminivorans TaxID=515897 RepID=UPI002FDB0238